MEYMKIAVVTDDRAYGEAVCRSLLIGNRNFDLALYGSTDFCKRWQQGGQTYREGFDLILWDAEGLERIYGGNLVWLTERVSQAVPEAKASFSMRQEAGTAKEAPPSRGTDASSENRFTIYKYSTSSAMVAAIFGIYSRLTGRRPAGTRPERVEIFAFVSWQGGCGCTTLAMAMGQELVRFYRKRVLYLSLEGTESTVLYMEVPEGMKTAGEYLYHLMTDAGPGGSRSPGQSETHSSPGTAGAAPFLEGYLVRDSYGMEAFAPADSCNPVSIAGREEIRRLLSALMESGRFDTILLDTGCGTGEAVREALRFADRICLVSSREEPVREIRYQTFLRYGVAQGIQPQRASAAAAGRRGSEPTAKSQMGRSAQEAWLQGRLLRIYNRSGGSHTAEGQAAGRREPASLCSSCCSSLRIAERDNPEGPLLLEGSFGRDVHKLAQMCYTKV